MDTTSCVPNETNDRCGIHTNSGVPNKMFYLLSHGGVHSNTGIGVTGIGIQTAMNVAMDANRYYWTSTTDFNSARNGMVLAAQPYGGNAVAQVKNAWAAVGVGAPDASYDFTDTDNDGITDTFDNCPLLSNVGQLDTDKDTWGDTCDAFINDPSEWIDTDLDGIGNNTDLDADGDGLANSVDNCTLLANPDQRDTDGDNYGNRCDADYDNNGVVNASDLAFFKSKFFTADPDADLNGNGVVNAADLAILKTSFFKPPGPSELVP